MVPILASSVWGKMPRLNIINIEQGGEVLECQMETLI